jgi:hypothetical protein
LNNIFSHQKSKLFYETSAWHQNNARCHNSNAHRNSYPPLGLPMASKKMQKSIQINNSSTTQVFRPTCQYTEADLQHNSTYIHKMNMVFQPNLVSNTEHAKIIQAPVDSLFFIPPSSPN